MTQKSNLILDDTVGPTQILREGDVVFWSISIEGISIPVTTPTMTWCKDGSENDLSATYLSGAMAITTDSIILTKITQNLKRGDYVIGINAVVEGMTQNVTTFIIIVKRKGEL